MSKAKRTALFYASIASACSSLAAWNYKQGYLYWAAQCALIAIDALLRQYHDVD